MRAARAEVERLPVRMNFGQNVDVSSGKRPSTNGAGRKSTIGDTHVSPIQWTVPSSTEAHGSPALRLGLGRRSAVRLQGFKQVQ